MSDRGTFITELIHCNQCADAFQKVCELHPDIISTNLDIYKDSRIVCGTVVTIEFEGEFLVFEAYIRDDIEYKLCHSLRMVVLGETANAKLVEFKPKDPRRRTAKYD